MFRLDLKQLCSALIFLIPALSAADSINNRSLAVTEGTSDAIGNNFEPEAGDNGSPTKKITVGGSRGSSEGAELSIYIRPDFTIPSVKEGFVWELNQGISDPIRFLIVTDTETEPVFDTIMPPPIAAKKYITSPTSLTKGIEYQWIMYICPNANCALVPPDVTRTTFKLAQ